MQEGNMTTMNDWEEEVSKGAKLSRDRELNDKIRAIHNVERTFQDTGMKITLGYGMGMDTVRIWDERRDHLLRVVSINGDSSLAIIRDLTNAIYELGV